MSKVIPDSELNVPARVDTFGMSFPVSPDVDLEGASVTTVNAGTADEQTNWKRSLPGGGFLAGGRGGVAWVEASLPKRAGDGNVEGVSLNEMVELARELYREACDYVEPYDVPVGRVTDVIRGVDEELPQPHMFKSGFDSAKILRCDLVRDFENVTELPAFLDGLATVEQRGGHKVARYADAKAGRAETLRVGPKAWACTLYDKYVESGSAEWDRRHNAQEKLWVKGDVHLPTPLEERLERPAELCDPGRMRFEARLRADVFKQKGMSERGAGMYSHMCYLLEDLEQAEIVMRRTTRVMFERVGFDREVSGIAQVASKINSIPEEEMTARTKRELVSYLMSTAVGIDLAWSRNTASKYRDMAANLGIVVKPGELGEQFTARLDFDAGTEEIVLAA